MGKTAKSASRALLLVLAGILVGTYIGYSYRNAQLVSNSHTLADLLVLEKHDALNFRLQTNRGQAFEVRFCPGAPVDLEPGQKLKIMVYEQLPDCKNISGPKLGYLAYVDARGNRVKYGEMNARN